MASTDHARRNSTDKHHRQSTCSQDDNDDQVIGVPNAPYREPLPQVSGPSSSSSTFVTAPVADNEGARAITETPPRSEHDAPVVDSPPAYRERDDGDGDANDHAAGQVELTGWRAVLDGLAAIAAFFLPWTSSMIFAWSAVAMVHVSRLPNQVLVNAIASTVEVASLVFFTGFAAESQTQSATPNQPLSNPSESLPPRKRMMNTWYFFLVVDPIATGAYAMITAKGATCDEEECPISRTFVSCLGAYRMFAVLGTLFLFLKLAELLSAYLKKQAARAQRERIDSDSQKA